MHTLKMLPLIFSLLLAGLLAACTAANDSLEPALPDSGSASLPNPASAYCTAQGGNLEIRTDADGAQSGVCVFADGSECEEWAYFRGECAPGNTKLFETLWVLQSYGGQAPIANSNPTLRIQPDWQIGGSSGCNSFFAQVTRDGDAWQIGQIGSTMMACMETMEQEMAIFALLANVNRHTLEAGRLTLHAPEGDLVYVLPQNASLEGNQWTLSGVAEGDAISSMWVDAEIYMRLQDGQVNGYTGCNDFFGSYTLEGEALRFSPLGMTKRACTDERGPRELALVTALEQVTTYRIELNSLTLLDENGRLLLTFTLDETR